MCGSEDKTSWKPGHLNSNTFVKAVILMVDLKIHGVFCDGNFNSNLLCITQLINTW
jgi:hypothetical protein